MSTLPICFLDGDFFYAELKDWNKFFGIARFGKKFLSKKSKIKFDKNLEKIKGSSFSNIICQILEHCLQIFRIKIFDQFFHRRQVSNSFARFDSVIAIYKSYQFKFPMLPVFEFGLVVPHLHNGPDYSFCFPVRLRVFHFCEPIVVPFVNTNKILKRERILKK